MKFVAFGIATVLDTSSKTVEIQALRATAASAIDLPSYLASGTVAVGRHNEALRAFRFGETNKIETPAEAEAFVLSRINGPDKSDFIKAVADLPGLEEAVLASLVDSAHRHGKLAVAQASQIAAYGCALRAGFDIVTCVPLDGALDAATAQELSARGVVCVPTLINLQKRVMPLLLQQGEGQNTDQRQQVYTHIDFNHTLATVKTLYDAGVRIGAGTGANVSPDMPILAGESLHDELELLVRAGMSSGDALRAATIVPATAFGLSDRGMIQCGARADLILVEGDPMRDISSTRRIRKVWIKGVEVDLNNSSSSDS